MYHSLKRFERGIGSETGPGRWSAPDRARLDPSMSTKPSRRQNAGGTTTVEFRNRDDDTNHCREDALSVREFERAVEATYRLDDDYFAVEARMILFAAGRLGMRSGEIAHMSEEWIDWRREMIQIPKYERCHNGRDGGICGHCRQAAKQMVEHNDGLDLETAESMMWGPKTEAGAREIPIDATKRAALALEEYFDRFDQFMASQSTIGRRVSRIAEAAQGLDVDSVYPHALRATCGSYWAARGLNSLNLKALMGWAEIDTALKYIESSGERTAMAVRRATA